MPTRRAILGGIGVAASAVLAGCSGDGDDVAAVGESHERGGLRFTLQSLDERSAVDVVEDDVRPRGTATADFDTTRLEAGTDGLGRARTFLLAALHVENVGDESAGLPSSAPPPPPAAGSVYVTGTGRRVTPLPPPGDLLESGEPRDSFDEVVAEREWSLSPGEAVSGWLLFRIGADFDRETNSFSVELNDRVMRWELNAPK
jgi:hypothetical protein